MAEMSKEQRTTMYRTQEEWRKGHTQRIYIRFNCNTDADILEKLNSMENVQGYIKELIRADISREGAETK